MDQKIYSQQPNQEEPEKNLLVSVRDFIWDLVKVFAISLAIILPVRYFIAQPFIVQGSSMEPTYHSGEYLIIDEVSYRLNQPERGDVVVFKYPKDTTQYFIKRIIGLPGERIRIQNGGVIVYNKESPQGLFLNEEYLQSKNITNPIGSNETLTLGSEEYYVLGDNRLQSSDSRFWGPVHRKNIVGKVFVRAFPFQSFDKFETPVYNQ